MDGTALRILGRLPSFQRITCTVPIAKRIAVEQHIMRNPKKRFFVHSIFVSSKTKSERDEFTVSLKKKLREAESIPFNRFFVAELGGNSEEYMKSGRRTVILTKVHKGKARNSMGNCISVPGMIQHRLDVFSCCTSTPI